MKRAKHDLNLPGFQIGSHVGEWNLDAPELYPIYKVLKLVTKIHKKSLISKTFFQTAQELDLALFVHPWDMQMGGRFSKYWLPWLVGKKWNKVNWNKIMNFCFTGMPAETATAIVSLLMVKEFERNDTVSNCVKVTLIKYISRVEFWSVSRG